MEKMACGGGRLDSACSLSCSLSSWQSAHRSAQNPKSKGEKENIFGVQQEDRLPEINGLLDKEQDFDLRLSVFGAIGQWNDEANVFIEEGPSWVQMVAELLGPRHSLDIDAQVAIGENEPRKLGPFRLAFLEALIRAADVRASRKPRAHSPSLS